MKSGYLSSTAATAVVVFAIGSADHIAARGQAAPAQAPTFQLLEATIGDVHAAFASGSTTCRALVDAYLARIEAYNKSGPVLNAVQTINQNARQEADRLDAAFKSSGLIGPLHCIPVLLKDQVETSDMPTTYGSAVFNGFRPQRDATIVTRLKKAGAIILAKTTMGELASGYSSSAAGIIRNAYDPTRNASGSSGGTGAGIAANFGMVGIGEDTGGSIRGPAAVASLVGLRPTVPLVSRFGMLPARPSTDTLGPIARTVTDTAIVLNAIAGYDANDRVTAYAVGRVPPSYTAFLDKTGLKGARIGVIREPMDERTDPASEDYKKVHVVIDKAIAELKTLGAELVDPIAIPGVKDRMKKLYDGNVFETEPATNAYLAQHPNAPVKTLRDILLSGKVVPSRSPALMNSVGRTMDDPGYLQILLLQEETRQLVLGLMAERQLDAVVYATFDHQPDVLPPDIMATAVSLTPRGNNRVLSPVLGFPAISVPAGFTADGIPVGLELMARPFTEGMLLKFAFAFEQATHHRTPPKTTPALQVEPSARR